MKYVFTLLLAAMLFANNVYAQNQQQTAYQKKIVELMEKYYKIFYGYNRPLTSDEKTGLELAANGGDLAQTIIGKGIFEYTIKHSEAEAKRVVNQMGYDFDQAEKLKTSVDFRREYENSDAGTIRKYLKMALEAAIQKGEFEKEADYQERLKNISRVNFDKSCILTLKLVTKLHYNLQKELSTYNSGGEFFMVSFNFNGIKWQSKLNIPIANAEGFKNNWSNFDAKIDDYNWCFVGNNLCPTLVTLTDGHGESYKCPLTLKNQSDITISFDKLGINNPYLNLKGYVFKYSYATAEAKRLDSLNHE